MGKVLGLVQMRRFLLPGPHTVDDIDPGKIKIGIGSTEGTVLWGRIHPSSLQQ